MNFKSTLDEFEDGKNEDFKYNLETRYIGLIKIKSIRFNAVKSKEGKDVIISFPNLMSIEDRVKIIEFYRKMLK